MKKKIAWIVLIGILLTGCARTETETGEMTVVNFKCGKADASLVYTEDAVILIDTGETDDADDILEYLKDNSIASIDVLIITHFDKDHVGGGAQIIAQIDIGQIYTSNYPKDSDEYNAFLQSVRDTGVSCEVLREDISLSLGSMTVQIDAPQEEEYAENPSNNSSLITKITFGDTVFLFMGDAQNERIDEYLNTGISRVDYLKVPYHGNWMKSLKYLLAQTRPKIAVITSSKANPEDEKTVSALEDYGAQVYLTRNGDCIFLSDGRSVKTK